MYSVIAFDGQVYGPVDIRTLIAWCQEGRIVAATHLVETNTGRSFIASDLPQLSAVLAQAQQAGAAQAYPSPQQNQSSQYQNIYQTYLPPQAPNPYSLPQQVPQFPSSSPAYAGYGASKSRSKALWLCFLLGPFGAHRFYLGHTTSAVAMLAVGLLSLTGNWYFIAISLIWCTIDFVRISSGQMTDSEGLPPR